MANLLKIGGIGCIIAIIGAIVGIVGGIMAAATMTRALTGGVPNIGAVTASFATIVIVLALTALISTIGFLLITAGTFGLQKKYQTPIPMVAGIFGIIAAIMNLAASGLLLAGGAEVFAGTMLMALGAPSGMAATYITVSMIGGITGILFWILLGVTFIIKRTAMGHGSLPLVTGILLILFFIPLVGVILLMIMFFKLAKEGAPPAPAAPQAAPPPPA